METTDLHDLHQSLVRVWNVVPVDSLPVTWDALEDTLTRRVAFLLDHDYGKLINAMYILDVPEERFVAASATPNAARSIADLILEREAEKVVTRKQYRRDHSVDVTYREPPDPDSPASELEPG